MSRITQHVVPNAEGTWSVKKGGALKATRNFGSKTEATSYGRMLAQKQKAELIVHRKDGTIQNPNSYGRDPRRPIDRIK